MKEGGAKNERERETKRHSRRKRVAGLYRRYEEGERGRRRQLEKDINRRERMKDR